MEELKEISVTNSIYPNLKNIETNLDSSNHEIYRVTWHLEDHIDELVNLLQGASTDNVEQKLIQYMEENIEPNGWKAAWRQTQNSLIKTIGQEEPFDFIVDVVEVSRFELIADVTIEDVCITSDKLKEETLKNIKGMKLSVPILELYPLVAQDNPVANVAVAAEVIDQMRFFYEHIWQPWDVEEELCHYNEHLIRKRLQIAQDINNEVIPRNTSARMKMVKNAASLVQKQIIQVENKSGISSEDEEVDEQDVAMLFFLHKRLERLKSQYDTLQDPILRQLSVHHQQINNCNDAGEIIESSQPTIRVVIDSLSVQDTINLFNKMPTIIKDIPKVDLKSNMKFYPTLQLAIDTCKKGDVVILLPGRYVLNNLGCLAAGGTMCGLGEGVIIQGSADAGDIMLDLSLHDDSFHLLSLTLEPLPGQLAIAQHGGEVHMDELNIEGGDNGILIIGNCINHIKNCVISDCSSTGIECRGNAKVEILNCWIKDCEKGLQFHSDCKVSLKRSKMTGAISITIEVLWRDKEKYKNIIPLLESEQISQCFDEFDGNKFNKSTEIIQHKMQDDCKCTEDNVFLEK